MQNPFRKLPVILCLLTAFVVGLKQLREPDIWWQLLAGRWMLEHGEITRTDMFSYTMAGKPWINVKWLYEVMIAGMEKAMGPEIVILLQATVCVVVVMLLIRGLQYASAHLNKPFSLFFSIIGVLLFLVISENRMAGRPEMISHLFCAFYLFLFLRYPQGCLKNLFWLIPVQCLWANMHEGYPIGIVMIGTYVIGCVLAWTRNRSKESITQLRDAAILLVASVLVILLNPYGVRLWQQPFEIFRQVGANKYTTELVSISDAAYWTIQAKLHVALLVLVTVYWVAQFIQSRKQKDSSFMQPWLLSYLLLIPLFAYLSFTANRNIVFAQIILLPSVAWMIAWLVQLSKLSSTGFYSLLRGRAVVISSLIAIVCYVAVVTDTYYKSTKSANRYGVHINPLHNPTGAAEFIRQHKLKGPAFSDYFVSSYLLWHSYPSFKSFIDLRDLDVFSASFFDKYSELNNDPLKFNALDSQYHFNYVVLSTTQLKSLQQSLYWRDGFNLIYVDPVATIFLRDVPENDAVNRDVSVQKLFSWPPAVEDPAWAFALTSLFNPKVSYDAEDESNAPAYAALFYNEVGNYPMAIRLVSGAHDLLEEDARANDVLGSCYLNYANMATNEDEMKQRLDSAVIYLNKAKELDDSRPSVYASLAKIATVRDDFKAALEYIDTYMDLDDLNDQMYYLEGLCNRNLWQTTKRKENREAAIDAMNRSVALNPLNIKAHLYLAEAYNAEGDMKRARENFKKATAEDIRWYKDERQLIEQLEKALAVK